MASKEYLTNRRLKTAFDSGLPGLQAVRTELDTSFRGWPDWAIFCAINRICFIESKWSETGLLSHWTSNQRSFCRRRWNEGTKVWLCVGNDTSTCLIKAWENTRADYVQDYDPGSRIEWGKSIKTYQLYDSLMS